MHNHARVVMAAVHVHGQSSIEVRLMHQSKSNYDVQFEGNEACPPWWTTLTKVHILAYNHMKTKAMFCQVSLTRD